MLQLVSYRSIRHRVEDNLFRGSLGARSNAHSMIRLAPPLRACGKFRRPRSVMQSQDQS